MRVTVPLRGGRACDEEISIQPWVSGAGEYLVLRWACVWIQGCCIRKRHGIKSRSERPGRHDLGEYDCVACSRLWNNAWEEGVLKCFEMRR